MHTLLLLVALAAPAAAADTIRGAVSEALPAGPYCYVQLSDVQLSDVQLSDKHLPDQQLPDETWLAIQGACPTVGIETRAKIMIWRKDFPSARLGRTFARLGFGTLLTEETPR